MRAAKNTPGTIFPETETEDAKLLRTDANGLSVALGLRLLALFGGRLQLPYARGVAVTEFTCHPAQALFPAPSPGQTGDERYFQFVNTLTRVLPSRAMSYGRR